MLAGIFPPTIPRVSCATDRSANSVERLNSIWLVRYDRVRPAGPTGFSRVLRNKGGVTSPAAQNRALYEGILYFRGEVKRLWTRSNARLDYTGLLYFEKGREGETERGDSGES